MSKNGKFLALMALAGMVDIPKTEPKEITYGKPSTATSYDNMRQYLIICPGSSGTIKSGGTHPLVAMIADMKTVWGKILDETAMTEVKKNEAEVNITQVYYNIGRLVRRELAESDKRVEMVSLITSELSKNLNGVIQATKTVALPYARLWYITGAKLESLFGKWQDNKYRVETDIAAGLFTVLYYVVLMMHGHAKSWNILRRGIGTYTTIDGASRGNLTTFSSIDQSTWGAVMLASVNSVANLFGMSEALVDDDTIRNGKIITVEGADKIWDLLLSSSKWSWRFAKYTEVIPLFWLFNPETTADGGLMTDWSAYDMCPLKSNTSIDANHNFRFMYNEVFELVDEIVSFKFHNPKFATVKALFKKINLDAISLPPEGIGGLLLHQSAYYKTDAVDTDDLCAKFNIDEGTTGHMYLQIRRQAEQNTKILLIGDITIEQYRLVSALFGIKGVNYGGAQTDNLFLQLDIKGGFAFEIIKDEDRPYMIVPTPIDLIAGALAESALKSTVHVPRQWTYVDDPTTADEKWPISCEIPRLPYLFGRDQDPYKKLKHVIYDSNELDSDLLFEVIQKYLLPFSATSTSTTSTIAPEPIAVSATMQSDAPAIENETKIKENDPPLAVSATPEKDK